MKVVLSYDDYIECLFFTLRLWYSGSKGKVDFRSTGTKRDIGKYCTDFTSGKLAEIAFKRFLFKNFDLEIGLDFELHPGIASVDTDVTWVRSKSANIKFTPTLRVDIKGTKPTSKYFLVDAREFRNRPYDAYVQVFVYMPSDHLIRAVADLLDLPEDLQQYIKPLREIEAEIVGFCWREDVEKRGNLYKAGTILEDPEKPKKKLVTLKVDNYGFPLTYLRKSYEDWKALVSALLGEN